MLFSQSVSSASISSVSPFTPVNPALPSSWPHDKMYTVHFADESCHGGGAGPRVNTPTQPDVGPMSRVPTVHAVLPVSKPAVSREQPELAAEIHLLVTGGRWNEARERYGDL